MARSCGVQELRRIRSMLCGKIVPQNTPLAFIYAQQRQTLTKKQLQAVANALLSGCVCLHQDVNPLHALKYESEAFVVDRPAEAGHAPYDEEELERVTVDTCVRVAEVCRNSRVLKLYVNKMAHEMTTTRSQRDSDIC